MKLEQHTRNALMLEELIKSSPLYVLKIYLNFTEQYSFKVDRDNIGFTSMTSHI